MATAIYNRDVVLRDLPSLSPMAMKLVGKLARADVDFDEVERLIERDTVLCAEVLRTVNSARFARGQTVSRIGQAVMLLGANRLRKIALATTVGHVFGRGKVGPKWSPLRFNLHSGAVAVLAEILCAHLPVRNPEAAFLAGLLHDVGKFAIAVNLRRENEKILQLRDSGLTTVECEREVLGFDHAEISALMMERWEMGESIQWAVCCHHNPELDVTPETSVIEMADGRNPQARPVERRTVNLSRVLEMADRFVISLGMMSEPAPAELGEPAGLDLPGFSLPHAEIAASFILEFEEFREFGSSVAAQK